MAELLHSSAAVYDVVIVGGGPAGLSAALVLGRCRRHVLLCDTGTPRNAASAALHGYLTRDGVPPLDLLQLGRDELGPYGIELRDVEVTDIGRDGELFEVTIAHGDRVMARSVLLATGVRDHLPPVAGIDECYGVTVHHCPYCDGWEHRDKALAVVGHGAAAAGLALSLKTWSADVVLCTNGPSRLKPDQRSQLAAQQIAVHQARIARVDHEDRRVRRLVLEGAAAVPCNAIFFAGTQSQQCEFPRRLGCEFTRRGTVKTDHLGETCVPGIYVVGDASRDVQFAIVAAAEGAKAGVAINKALQARSGLAVTGT
jgi:thioredoxin reductase